MMRRILVAIAALAGIGFSVSAHAQSPAALTMQDRTFFGAVASASAGTAPNDADQSWSSDGRGGVVRYEAPDAARCRNFFLRQLNPEVRPAVIGKVCPLGGGEYAASDIRLAATASGGETGGTRGVVVRPVQPDPRSDPTRPPAIIDRPGATDDRPVNRGVAAPAGPVRGIAKTAPRVVVKPVLVQIGRTSARMNQNGGHAVVLLQNAAALRTRNLQLCESLLRNFDDAPLSDVEVGLRREADGTVSALRPIYWPVNERLQVRGSACSQRLLRYDFDRAQVIRDKLNLTGAGPYPVVTRSDERQAAIIDLTGMNATQIEQATRYFSVGLSQRGEVWNPQQFTPREQERSLVAVFGRDFPRVVLAAIRVTSAAGTTAGAAASGVGCLGDMTDTRRC